jgi:hypothetical protein
LRAAAIGEILCSMRGDIGLAAIVTEAFVDEFEMMKYSFELFHGTEAQWFVRCDRASLPSLSTHSNVHCTVFVERQPDRPDLSSEPFQRIMAEKMNVMQDAWTGLEQCRGVLFLDVDLVFTASVLPTLREMAGDVILVPNYYPEGRERFVALHGEFNGGFVFTRVPAFHEWWREAYRVDSSRFNEQGCLNEAHERFSIARLGPHANIGFWRSLQPPDYNAIPADCAFLHAHLYGPLVTMRHWLAKAFALHCVRFLMASRVSEHRLLFERILSGDRHGWFEASLRASGEWAPTGLTYTK